MTDLLSDVEAPSDAELISRVRGGEVAAYGQLFTRHKDAANRLARQLMRGPDADDLVSEAFAKVLTVLQGGGGPDVAFRAYLLTAVRRLHVDRMRAGQRVQTTDDLTPFDPGVPFQDTAVAGFESGAAAKAFASLPERWQLVLWHLEVEGQKPADIAPLLGMSANSVSALAYRAREGLRQAFLTMHISDLTETDCRWVNEHLGAFIRKGLSKRDVGKVQGHLDDCRRCTAMYLELTEVNDNLAGIIAPLLLGGAASGYLASTGVGSAGLLGLVSKVKDFVGANTAAVSAAGVTVGVAAAAATVAAITLGGAQSQPETAGGEAPVAVTSTPASRGANAPADVAPSAVVPAPSPTAPTAPSAATASAPSSTPTVGPGATSTPSATVPLAPTAALPTDALPTDALPTDGLPADVGTGEVAVPPSAGTSPSGSAPADSEVSLAGTHVDEQGVHVQAVGSPLPPTVAVRLTSAADGVRFDDPGDCTVTASGREAICDLIPGGAGARVPATAVGSDATSYAADLPFRSLADQPDADIDVSFEVPAGFRVADGTDRLPTFKHVRPAPVVDVDVAVSVPQTAVRPAAHNVYTVPVTASVSGAAASQVSMLTYTVAGGSFADGTTSTIRPVAAPAPTFEVVPSDANRPQLSITASVAAPLHDTKPDNDTATAPLSPYDVSLPGLTALTETADARGDQQFAATVHRDGFPGALVYSFAGTVLEPTSVDGDILTFTVHSDTDRTIGIRADLPVGFTDADPTDNTGEAAFSLPRDVDVALTVSETPVRPGADDRYAVPAAVTVSGPAAGRVSEVTYRVSGGSFADGSASTTRPADVAAPTFEVVPENRTTPAVTITASVPASLRDTSSGNDTATAPLRPYDVSLTGLAPVTERADASGDQEFTATVDDDGLRGVGYRLVDPAPGDAVVAGPVRVGDTVTVTVRSTSATAHALALEAVTPLGFTDANPDDNTASATWTPQPPPPLRTDLSLTALTPVEPVPDENGRYHLGTTLHVSGDVPPSVTLDVAAEAGVALVGVVGCDITAGGTQAVCGAPVDGTRLDLVLSAPIDSPTDVTVAVSAPGLFTEATPADNGRSTRLLPAPPPPVHDVDVAVSVPAAAVRPDANDRYTVPVTVTVSGPAAHDASEITYTVAGGSFVADDGTMRATTVRPVDQASPVFVVVPSNRRVPTVTISASVSSPLQDTDAGNDTVAVPLRPYDVSLTGLTATADTADAEGNQQFTATVDDDGFPGALAYTLTDGPAGAVLTAHPASDGRVTFTVHADGDAPRTVAVLADLPARFGDADPADNTTTSTWTPQPPAPVTDVDVAVSVPQTPVRPGRHNRYPVTANVAVSGPAADRVAEISYAVTGGSFVTASGPSVTTTRPADQAAPTFVVVPADGTHPSVTIRASVASPWQDTDAGNDSAAVLLRPYDVSLTRPVPVDETADTDGAQQFTATVHEDGLDGVTYALVDPAGGDTIEGTATPTGDTVAFTVRSHSAAAHDLAVQAVLPPGYTDADPRNNAASFRWTPGTADDVDVDVDVSLLDLSPATARPGLDDVYTLTGLVSVDGDPGRDLPGIRYTISGAEFVADADCTTSTCTEPATGTPTFRVHRPAAAGAGQVTVTANVPDGLRDANPDNDSARAMLKPYDVTLSGLTAGTGPADADGDQRFTAVLDSDGLSGVTFELADGPEGARLTPDSSADGLVGFTVHSDTDSGHRVAIRAVLPDGFTDTDPDNNTAAGATFTTARTADLALSASFLDYAQHDQHGIIGVSVRNAPATTLTFTVSANQPVKLTGSVGYRCSTDRQSATCTVSWPGTFVTAFGIDLPPGQVGKVRMTVAAADYADPNEADNTVTVGAP